MEDSWIPWQRRLPLILFAGLVMLLLVLPSLIVIPMSFSAGDYLEFPPRELSLRWYDNYFESSLWGAATEISFIAGISSALLASILGTAAAWGLRLLGRGAPPLLMMVLTMPLTVPAILTAIGIFYLYVRLDLVNTMFGLVLAHTMLALPFVLILVLSRLQGFDLNQVRVAESLGARPFKAFMLVALPQIRFAVIAGAVIAFLTSFDEVIVALFITGGGKSTITRVMFTSLRDQVDPTIASVSSMLILLSVVLVVVFQFFEGRATRAAPAVRKE